MQRLVGAAEKVPAGKLLIEPSQWRVASWRVRPPDCSTRQSPGKACSAKYADRRQDSPKNCKEVVYSQSDPPCPGVELLRADTLALVLAAGRHVLAARSTELLGRLNAGRRLDDYPPLVAVIIGFGPRVRVPIARQPVVAVIAFEFGYDVAHDITGRHALPP